jgi:dolichol-phosphate mannosyltransferase
MDKVVIIMPSYKEAGNIKKMIPELFDKEFPNIKGAEMHLLVVNDLPPDGSPDDGTGDIVKDYMKKYENLHILEGKKQGLGWAYIRGMKHAMKEFSADAVMEMDADFQHPPRFVKPMVEAYLNGADYVIGSRYVKGGSIPKEWALSRKAMSFFGNLYARIVLTKFSIHDMTTGFRLTKVSGVLDKIELDTLREPHMFAHKIDLLYRSIKNAKKVVEVPLEFAARTEEVSKFNIKEMIASYKTVMILGILDKKKFIKFGTVGFIGYVINAVTLELFSGTNIVSVLGSYFDFLKGTLISFVAEPSAWAAAFAAELAIVNNFVLNNIWTFKEVKITKPLQLIWSFLKFNLTSVGAIIIQFIVIGIMVVAFSDTRLIRQLGILVAMPLVLAFNYTMYNLFIWKTWDLKKIFNRGK